MKPIIYLMFALFLLSCEQKQEKYLHINEAYIGAPKTIKHDMDGYEDCLSCHTDNGDEDATQTPHPERINCIQCHVPANMDVYPEVKNTFKSGYTHKNIEEIEKIREKYFGKSKEAH